MKFYYLKTKFTFGRYMGDTIAEIADFDPSYIEWCILHLEDFNMDIDTIQKLESAYEHFTLSEEARKKLKR